MPRRDKTIRVGLIGCNRRGLWYGAIFDRIDPVAYSRLDPAAYHHMTYYNHVDLQIRRAEGFRLTKVYDPDAEAAASFSAAFSNRPMICKSIEEVVRDVDLIFIPNESSDGSAHVTFAAPALQAGVPTFIDRPLAATVSQARRMLSLARRRKVPLLSCSHMRMLPHAAWFKARFQEIGPPDMGIVQGHGPNPALIADGVELALFLFGDEFGHRVETVQGMGNWPLEILHLRFVGEKGKRILQAAIISNHLSMARSTFWAKAGAQRNTVESPDLDAFVQPEGGLAVMNAVRAMVRTGRSPVSDAQMIETVAVMEAGRRSHNRPRPFPLRILR